DSSAERRGGGSPSRNGAGAVAAWREHWRQWAQEVVLCVWACVLERQVTGLRLLRGNSSCLRWVVLRSSNGYLGGYFWVTDRGSLLASAEYAFLAGAMCFTQSPSLDL